MQGHKGEKTRPGSDSSPIFLETGAWEEFRSYDLLGAETRFLWFGGS